MSLTREQWLDMWISAKYIEIGINQLPNAVHKGVILKEIKNIKKLIQLEIGQQE